MEKVGELESVRWYREKGEAQGILTPKSVNNFQTGMKLVLSTAQKPNKNQAQVSTKVLKFIESTREITLSFDLSDMQRIQKFRCLFYPMETMENEYIYDSNAHQFKKRNPLEQSGQLLSKISPFVKKQGNVSNTLLIISSRRDLTPNEQLQDFRTVLTGISVVLSHSNKICQKETLCRAQIQSVDICDSRVVISVSNKANIDIWEDLDIWIYPSERQEDDDDVKTAIETDIFSRIENGWKYLRGEFKRFRTNEDGEWKNEYSTILQMKPVDEKEQQLVKFIEKERNIVGPIIVRVNRVVGNIENVHEDEQNTIYISIVGFESTSTKVLLSKEIAYYLELDRKNISLIDETLSENESQSSCCSTEDDVLEGYSLVENVDELCEIIGELQLVESDFDSYNETSHVRLAFVSANTKFTKRFICLEGRFVKLTSVNDEEVSILALVTRVVRDLLILTVVGVPETYTRFEISKRFDYEIRVDHQFERFVVKKKSRCKQTDNWLKIQENKRGNDLKSVRYWHEQDRKTKKSRLLCTFAAKRRGYDLIDDGKLVLLSQCWMVSGVVDRKTNFVYGIKRNRTDQYVQKDSKTVCFEIVCDENNNCATSLSKSFFFLSTECSMLFEKGCGWEEFVLINRMKERIYCRGMIDQDEMFDVVNWNFKCEENVGNEVCDSSILESRYDDSSFRENRTEATQSNISYESDIHMRMEPMQLNELDLKEIGFVNIFHVTYSEELGNKLVLFVLFDEVASVDEIESLLFIGQKVFFTLDHMSQSINIVGDIIKKQTIDHFMVAIDPDLSNQLYLMSWIKYMYMFKIPSMKMLCHVQK